MKFNPQSKLDSKMKISIKSNNDLSKLIKIADDKIRETIRKRDSDEDGFAICFTCPNSAHYSQMEVGHFVRRKEYALRWDLLNCHLQCKECNRNKEGNLEVYAANIDKIYGIGTADLLKRIGAKTTKLNRFDLEEQIKYM